MDFFYTRCQNVVEIGSVISELQGKEKIAKYWNRFCKKSRWKCFQILFLVGIHLIFGSFLWNLTSILASYANRQIFFVFPLPTRSGESQYQQIQMGAWQEWAPSNATTTTFTSSAVAEKIAFKVFRFHRSRPETEIDRNFRSSFFERGRRCPRSDRVWTR